MIANWNYPTHIRVGTGRVKELSELCKDHNITTPLFVTDTGLADLEMIKQIIDDLKAAKLNCTVFSNIHANPIGEDVDVGVESYKQNNSDGVIAFGGGSALDVAKAIALMVGQNRSIWDFEDIGDNWKRVDEAGICPILAVPTTAGTGSEVGRASVIIDQSEKIKKIIFHPKMLPNAVILDPEVTTSLPPHITAATGMDALSHNLEAYCSPFYHPMAEGIALEGIRLVKDYLPKAYKDGNDLEARTQMLVSSSMGATAFQKGLGGMHALAHPLGALFNAHHGLLNAILMPYVLKANQSVIEQRITRLSRYINLPTADFSGFMQWILDLRSELAIPHTLAEISIDNSCQNKIGKMAVADPSAGGNPIQFDEKQYQQIFKNALNGNL